MKTLAILLLGLLTVQTSGAAVLITSNQSGFFVTVTESIRLGITGGGAPSSFYLVIENALTITEATVNEPMTAFGSPSSIGAYFEIAPSLTPLVATNYAPWGTWSNTSGSTPTVVDLLIGFHFPPGIAGNDDFVVVTPGTTQLNLQGGTFLGSGPLGITSAYLTANDGIPPTPRSAKISVTLGVPEPSVACGLSLGLFAIFLTRRRPRANKTDADNGPKAICRASNVLRSPSPDPSRSANYNTPTR